MKAFQFRLERVLAWRGTELSLAEAKVEELLRGLRTTETALVQIWTRRTAAQAALGGGASVTGSELVALEMSRVWAVREGARLAGQIAELRQSVEAQKRRVSEARRAVKLVERLKERQQALWKAAVEHEAEELSGEFSIAQWRRLHATSETPAGKEPPPGSPAAGRPGL